MLMLKSKTFVLTLLLALNFPLSIVAQKELKALKSYVKAGRSADALSEVNRLTADSAWKENPQIYALAFQAHSRVLDTQNEKMYLKQSADTAAFFGAVRGMFSAAHYCERAECQLVSSGKGKVKYRTAHATVLADLLPNLFAAARYYYSHNRFNEAEDAAYLFLNTYDNLTFWGKVPHAQVSTLQRRLASLIHVQGNYQMKKYERVFTYASDALEYQPARAEVLDELAYSRLQMGDSVAYRDTLLSAIREFPERESFFEQLEKYYLEKEQYVSLLSLANEILERDSTRIDAMHSAAYSLFILDRESELQEMAHKLLAHDSNDGPGNYYTATLYMRRAEAIDLPIYRNNPVGYRAKSTERKQWYALAREPMEKYRELRPDNARLWAPKLYDIYLHLNMGKEFEEINKIMKTIK